MASFTQRMIGAAMLDPKTYEEVEADESAIGQAMIVVVVSSLANGIGSLMVGGLSGLFWGTLIALFGWFIWAVLTFVIGTKLLPEPQTKSDIGELLRTIGFATSPGILRVVGILPWIGWLLSFLVSIWMLAATVIAVRQALDYKSTGRAVGVCVIGFVIYLMISFVLAAVFGLGGAMTGAFG